MRTDKLSAARCDLNSHPFLNSHLVTPALGLKGVAFRPPLDPDSRPESAWPRPVVWSESGSKLFRLWATGGWALVIAVALLHTLLAAR